AAVGLQVEPGPAGLRQRPFGGTAPMPAMLEAAVAVASPRAATHDKDAHRWLLVDAVGETLDPAVEPAPAQFEEILREVPVDCSGGADLDLTGMARRAVAMRPRPEDQLHQAMPGARQADIVLHRGSRIRVVPTRQMHNRHIGITVI